MNEILIDYSAVTVCSVTAGLDVRSSAPKGLISSDR
jgi:hypothetical protein